ncbi:MAG: hypothetical protein JSV88_25570 [Candidatus Aminicenantes bacterium]|nr:MAG: hypothetical protein JSV88_25570 [Candidatus Aminicenantes bacterium]
MGNLTEPKSISYDWLNQFVLWLGFGDTSEPSTNQVRMFYENGKFILRAFDGNEFKDIQPDFDTPIKSSITSGKILDLDNSHFIFVAHNGYGNGMFYSGGDEDHKIIVNDGGSLIRMDHSGLIRISVSNALVGSTFTDDIYILLDKNEGIEIKTHQLWQCGKEVVLANNEIESTGIPHDAVGFLKIKNVGYTNDKAGAIYSIGCHMLNSGGVMRHAGANTYYSCNQGVSSVNVYIDSQEVKIENKSGTTLTIRYVFEGGLV